MRRFWTTTELAAIREHYPDGGITAVEPLLPGRTRSAIYQQARMMGLKSSRFDPVRGHWPNSPDLDEAIRAAHATAPKKGEIKRLAARLGRPQWWVSKRARELGLITPRFREQPWSAAELALLDETAEITPQAASLRLKRAGFQRTVTAIIVKRKRQGIRVSRDGYSAREAGQLLGYEESVLSRWVRIGKIKASGTAGAARSDGRTTAWHFTDRDLREFIINNPMAIELRRVPAAHQPWLIGLLSGRGPNA